MAGMDKPNQESQDGHNDFAWGANWKLPQVVQARDEGYQSDTVIRNVQPNKDSDDSADDETPHGGSDPKP